MNYFTDESVEYLTNVYKKSEDDTHEKEETIPVYQQTVLANVVARTIGTPYQANFMSAGEVNYMILSFSDWSPNILDPIIEECIKNMEKYITELKSTFKKVTGKSVKLKQTGEPFIDRMRTAGGNGMFTIKLQLEI